MKMFLCQNAIFKGLPIILVVIALASSTGTPSEDEINPISYFKQFGYLERGSNSIGRMIMNEELLNATKEFQTFFGLSPTGELDDETKKMMSAPRCGIADKDPRLASYEIHTRWATNQLKYKILNHPSNPKVLLTPEEVRSEIKRAFDLWSQHTDLTFVHTETGPVHIEIKFGPNNHGCPHTFGGPTVLAHAFFPAYGGDAHFNDAKTWTMNVDDNSTNLFIVAAHEFGHSLGLDHTKMKSALMYPIYQRFTESFPLHDDDIEGIQALYGKKTEPQYTVITPNHTSQPKATAPPKKTAIPYPPDMCRNPKVDAMFNSADGQAYAFKGAYYFKFTTNSVVEGYPKLISKSWPDLPRDIDAALTLRNRKTYFFKGSKCWRYDGKQLEEGFPKKIKDEFPGIPDNLDAASSWSTGMAFFKGNKFWYFEPSGKPHVHSKYPQPISNWEGVPDNLNAALEFSRGGYTYFFKDHEFYRFHHGKLEVEVSYPKSTAKFWFNCDSSAFSQLTTDSDNYDSGKITTDTEDFYYQYTDTELSEQ